MAELQPLAERGDVRAAVSLAGLEAFAGQWQNAGRHAAMLVSAPTDAVVGNVFVEMIQLMARAGFHGVPWVEIVRVAERGLAFVAEMEIIEFGRVTLSRQLEALLEYAKTEGRPGTNRYTLIDGTPQIERSADAYRSALSSIDPYERRFKKPGSLALFRFSLAAYYGDDAGMIDIYRSREASLQFDQILHVARALVRSGDIEAAWSAIEQSVARWLPVDASQLVPLQLITDPLLRKLASPERLRSILATPRALDLRTRTDKHS